MKKNSPKKFSAHEEDDDQYQSYLDSVNINKRIRPPGVLNILFNLPLNKVMNTGEKEKYQFGSLFDVGPEFTHEHLASKYKFTEAEILKRSPMASFKAIAIFSVFYDYMMSNGIYAISFVIEIFAPIVLKKYLEWLEDENGVELTGWLYLILLLLICYSKPLLCQQAWPYLHRTGIKIEMIVRVWLKRGNNLNL